MPDASSPLDGDGATAKTCPDGSTLDLDGDGILWCDDPIESVTVPMPAIDLAGAVHRDAFAVLMSDTCLIGSPCPHTLFAANPQGKRIVRSDSTQLEDQWANRWTLTGPFISRQGNIYVGRRESRFVGDTVTFDPATNTATVRGDGALASYSLRDATRRPALGIIDWWSVTSMFATLEPRLVEPQTDGTLTTVGMADRMYRPIDSGSAVLLPMNPALVIAEDSTGRAWKFRPGDSAVSDLSPPVPSIRDISALITSAGVATCIATDAGAVLYEQTSSAITSTPLPFGYCNQLRTRRVGTRTLYEGLSADVNGDGMLGHSLYDRVGNTFVPIVVDSAAPLRVLGDEFIVVIEKTNGPQPVWIYHPGSAPQLVVSDLERVDASVAGDVLHVVGIRRVSTFDGPLVLMRMKTGTPDQTLEVRANASVSTAPVVVTSKEGAAIVGYLARYWFAPSSSFAIGSEIFGSLAGGGVRGARTIVIRKDAAFLYREVAGVPELVSIMATPINALSDLTYKEIDSPLDAPSEWFKYEGSGSCVISRVKDTVQGPTLQSAVCDPADHRVIGTSSDGSLFVAGPGAYHRQLFKLSLTGPELVAHNPMGISALYDYTRGARVIGWISPTRSVCLDEQPRRCWAVPPDSTALDTVLESDGTKHHVAHLVANKSQQGVTITIVRSIGPGLPSN